MASGNIFTTLFRGLFGPSKEAAKTLAKVKEANKGKAAGWFAKGFGKVKSGVETFNSFGQAAGYIGSAAQFFGAGKRRSGTSAFAMQAGMARRSDGKPVPFSNNLFNLGKYSSRTFNQSVSELNLKNDKNVSEFENLTTKNIKKFTDQITPQFSLGDTYIYSRNLDLANKNHNAQLKHTLQNKKSYKLQPISTKLRIQDSFEKEDESTRSIKGYVKSTQMAGATAILEAVNTVNENLSQTNKEQSSNINKSFLDVAMSQSNFNTQSLKEIQNNLIDLENTSARNSAENHKTVYEGLSRQITGHSDVQLDNLELIRKQQENMQRSSISIAMEQNKINSEYRLADQKANGGITLVSLDSAIGRLTTFVTDSQKTMAQIDEVTGETGRVVIEQIGKLIGTKIGIVALFSNLIAEVLVSGVRWIGDKFRWDTTEFENGVYNLITANSRAILVALDLDPNLFSYDSMFGKSTISVTDSMSQLGTVYTGGKDGIYDKISPKTIAKGNDSAIDAMHLANADITLKHEGGVNANDGGGFTSNQGFRLPTPKEWSVGGIKPNIMKENLRELYEKQGKNPSDVDKVNWGSVSSRYAQLVETSGVQFGPKGVAKLEEIMANTKDSEIKALYDALMKVNRDDTLRVYMSYFDEGVGLIWQYINLISDSNTKQTLEIILDTCIREKTISAALADFFYQVDWNVKTSFPAWFHKHCGHSLGSHSNVNSVISSYSKLASIVYSAMMSTLRQCGKESSPHFPGWEKRFRSNFEKNGFKFSIHTSKLDEKSIIKEKRDATRDLKRFEKGQQSVEKKLKKLAEKLNIPVEGMTATENYTNILNYRDADGNPILVDENDVIFRTLQGEDEITVGVQGKALDLLKEAESLYSKQVSITAPELNYMPPWTQPTKTEQGEDYISVKYGKQEPINISWEGIEKSHSEVASYLEMISGGKVEPLTKEQVEEIIKGSDRNYDKILDENRTDFIKLLYGQDMNSEQLMQITLLLANVLNEISNQKKNGDKDSTPEPQASDNEGASNLS